MESFAWLLTLPARPVADLDVAWLTATWPNPVSSIMDKNPTRRALQASWPSPSQVSLHGSVLQTRSIARLWKARRGQSRAGADRNWWNHTTSSWGH
jgi:hypothetical protein